jgi:hypothetical protein
MSVGQIGRKSSKLMAAVNGPRAWTMVEMIVTVFLILPFNIAAIFSKKTN